MVSMECALDRKCHLGDVFMALYLGVHLWCAVVYTPLKCYKNGIIADTLKSHCVHNLRVRSVCVKLLLCMFVLYIRYCNIDKPIKFVDALPPAKNVVHACTGYRGFEPVYAIKQSNPTLHTSTKNSYYYQIVFTFDGECNGFEIKQKSDQTCVFRCTPQESAPYPVWLRCLYIMIRSYSDNYSMVCVVWFTIFLLDFSKCIVADIISFARYRYSDVFRSMKLASCFGNSSETRWMLAWRGMSPHTAAVVETTLLAPVRQSK